MKLNKLVIFIMIASIVGTVLVFFKLPDTIPIHWNYKGEVDDYKNKLFIFVSAFLPLVIYFFVILIPRIDPKRENYLKHEKAYYILKMTTVFFLILMHWGIVLVGLGIEINISLVTMILVGVLMIILGNFLPQLRHNYFAGIRTPWTLSDEEVWKKTHRFGGYVFVVLGFVIIGLSFIKTTIAVILLMTFILGSVVLLFAYSYVVFRAIKKA